MSGECISVSVGGKCTLRDECTVPHILQYMSKGLLKLIRTFLRPLLDTSRTRVHSNLEAKQYFSMLTKNQVQMNRVRQIFWENFSQDSIRVTASNLLCGLFDI